MSAKDIARAGIRLIATEPRPGPDDVEARSEWQRARYRRTKDWGEQGSRVTSVDAVEWYCELVIEGQLYEFTFGRHETVEAMWDQERPAWNHFAARVRAEIRDRAFQERALELIESARMGE